MRNLSKEEEFYKKDFFFSYSSINKLLFSPAVFYKHYVLRQREDRQDAHLVGGRLVHCLLLEPEEFDKRYAISIDKVPTKTIKPLLDALAHKAIEKDSELIDFKDDMILYLSGINLYQKLSSDEKRVAKIVTDENIKYFEYKKTLPGKEVIDKDLYDKCCESIDIIKSNEEISKLLYLDGVSKFRDVNICNECALESDFKDEGYGFGLRGILDNYTIDHDNKTITINDFKTTGKALMDFPDSVEYYKYWLQACLYKKLLYKNIDKSMHKWKFMFNFIVIDKYNQVYPFPVSESSMEKWEEETKRVLNIVNYHYSKKDYSLPYELATEGLAL